MNKNGLNTGLLITGIITGAFLMFLSIYNFKAGIYIITLLGFCIFTLSRLIYQDVPWGTFIEILIFISTIGMFVSFKIKNIVIGPLFKSPIFILLTIYIIYIAASIVNPAMNSKLGWIGDFKRQLALYCYFLLIFIGLKGYKEQVQFGKILMILLIISAIYGCFQQFFGFAEFEMNYITRSEARRKLLFMIGGVKRKFSLFSDPSSLGISMAATASILFSLIAANKFSKKTIYLSITLVICLMTLAFSGTRTAYLAFIGGAGFYFLLTINKKATRVLGIILALGLGFIMIAPIYSNPTINRIRSAFDFDDEASLNVRDVNRKSIQPYMLTHPFGGGLGTTGGSGTKYNPGHPLAGFATDSGFLQTSAELGWLALLLLLLQYYVIIRSGLAIYFTEINRNIKILIAASLVCVFTFVISQYAQVAVGQFPDSFLFMGAVAIIAKNSVNISQNKPI